MDDPNFENGHRDKILAALLASAPVLAAALWLTDTFANTGVGEELFKDLCDSFFTVGLLFVLSAVLILSAKNGTFNFFTYNSRMFMSVLLPMREEKKRDSYHEYVLKKEEQRKGWRVRHIVVIGAVYCALGAVFLALYSHYPY